MSIRLLPVVLLAALALGCSDSKPTAAPGEAQAAGAAPAAAAATPKQAPGAADGSPFSVTHQTQGSGPMPTAADTVRVHYAGRLASGLEFDSSIARGEPATFPLNGVIPCWTKGVAEMKVGGKATLVCPPDMAYGASGIPGAIPPDATLTFDVELLAIEPAPQ